MSATKRISNTITLTRGILDIKVIGGKKLESTLLPHIEFLLSEQILQGFMIGIENEALA